MQHPSLKAVLERFPSVGERAADVFEQDDNFRELCLEYEACLESVGRLGCGGDRPQPICDEYRALLLRLEGELLRYLEDKPHD
jgi:hypothetical protein